MKQAQPSSQEPAPSAAKAEREGDILLELGHDITRVREKNDLIILFTRRIKSWFYFSHAAVSLISPQDETYGAFLLDNIYSPLLKDHRYLKLVTSQYTLNESFMQAVLNAEGPVSFLLEDVIDQPQCPPYLPVYYEVGIREVLMTRLMKEEKPIGFFHVYSDRQGSFTTEFRNIIKGIAPQLSSAISNIIKNEELLKKEQEKSFLLDFSSEIATVRTRDELAVAAGNALNKLTALHGYAICRVNEDGNTMSSYIFDPGKLTTDSSDEKELNSASFPLNDGLQNRVLDSPIPLLFSIDREVRRGITSSYLHFLKNKGYKTMAGIRLRNGEMNLGILWLAIEEINIQLLQGICAQISIALANIMANEEVAKQQRDLSFLLDFSRDVAHVRTKPELEAAIFRVFDMLLHTKLSMIQVIGEDGFNLYPFMYDQSLRDGSKEYFDENVVMPVTVEENYTAKVLASEDGLVFNIDEEVNSGNARAKFWKTTGLENMYSLPLRVGDRNIGTLWLLANRLSQLVLRGLAAQISIAIANIQANEKLFAYKKQLENENLYLKEQIGRIYNFSEIIGSGPEMQEVYRLMSLVADSNTSVLILGETGTGKELIARAIHNASSRKDKLMVKVNCAALPSNLVESELFGHERGAFTGAFDRRIGKFELANQSTLFLDEIGELPLEAQAKLLRVIQEREVERIGGKQTIKVDVRLVVATNRNLEEEVKAGRFRADLYFRLNVFPINLPPLRDRIEDIDSLTQFFVAKYSKNSGRKIMKIAPRVFQQLRSYTWPGNVRELEHLIERSVLLTTDNTLQDVYIPRKTVVDSQDNNFFLSNRSLEDVERSYIIEILKKCAGKISGAGGAAEILKVPGNTLHSKMKKLGITKADYFSK